MADATDTTSEHAEMPPASAPHGGGHTARHPSPKEYIRIALILGAITAAEVGIYYANISRGLLIPSRLFFAIVKFALVECSTTSQSTRTPRSRTTCSGETS